MSKSLAVELAPYGITVNSVSPGVTNTDFLNSFPSQMKEIMISKIPAKRLADPKDIASVVSFLCSRNADYITGINIPVAGGMVM
jgi:NAD(P)-dependent dehydrogenase (short-subunit alcohol dehydrogenase family)